MSSKDAREQQYLKKKKKKKKKRQSSRAFDIHFCNEIGFN